MRSVCSLMGVMKSATSTPLRVKVWTSAVGSERVVQAPAAAPMVWRNVLRETGSFTYVLTWRWSDFFAPSQRLSAL